VCLSDVLSALVMSQVRLAEARFSFHGLLRCPVDLGAEADG
jgi:hypothetical protein